MEFNTDDYITLLKSYSEKIFYVCPYPGNSGDRLITMGTYEILNFLEIQTTDDPKEAEVLLWPGGCPSLWGGPMNGWERIWKINPSAIFIIGPATFKPSELNWETVIGNATVQIGGVMARDRVSFKNLKSVGWKNVQNIALSNDPALYLVNSDWLQKVKSDMSNDYVLLAFRHDRESKRAIPHIKELLFPTYTHGLIRVINAITGRLCKYSKLFFITISLMGKEKIKICDVSLLKFDDFINTLKNASEVHTDRLHCLLLAAMLGKKVVAYQTSHGKLEGVYENSLTNYENVFLKHRFKK